MLTTASETDSVAFVSGIERLLPSQKLTRGQIGTVVEHLDEGGEQALLVEFSDDQGRTYAMVDLKSEQLIVLHRNIEAA